MRVKPQLLSTRQTGRALTNDHLDLDGAAQASSGVCSAKVAQQPEGLFHGRHLALRRAGVWWRRGPLTRPSTGRRRPIGPAWTELVEAAAGSSPGLYRPGSADDRRPMAKSGTAPGLIRVVGARTWVVRAAGYGSAARISAADLNEKTVLYRRPRTSCPAGPHQRIRSRPDAVDRDGDPVGVEADVLCGGSTFR